MEQNYVISITNTQNIDGSTEELTLTTTGSYLEKNGKRYIVYTEYDQDTQRSQTSTLKIDNNENRKVISLIRHSRGSDTHTNLVLESGKRHLCQYGTPYGNLTLGVFTKRVDDQLDEHGGNLTVEYTLDINSNLSSTNAILITVKESQPSDL